MRSRTSITCDVAGPILAICMILAPCESSQRFDRLDTGQSRELINRPSCGILDPHVDAGYCEFARRQ